MRFAAGAALAAALLPAVPASAPAQEFEAGENICLPTLRRWNGTVEDVRRITADPVPASYVQVRQSCGGPARAEDLVGWHLRFGSAETVVKALAFVERRDSEGREPPSAIASGFERRVREAERGERDLARLKREEPGRPNQREAEGSAALYNLSVGASPYVDALVDWLDMAELYLSAAERFSEHSLREAAGRKFAPIEAVLPRFRLPSNAEVAPERRDMRMRGVFADAKTGLDRRIALFRLRLALFDATREPTTETYQRLNDLGLATRTPALDQIFAYAFQDGNQLCDIPDNAPEMLKEACEDEHDFSDWAMQFKFLEARVGLLRGNEEPAALYIRIHEQDPNNGVWEAQRGDADPRVVALMTGIAELRLQKALRSEGKPDSGRVDEALEAFVLTLRLVDPASDPVRFRQIAERTLETDARADRLAQAAGEKRYLRFAATMAYIRVVLSHLDEIAQARI